MGKIGVCQNDNRNYYGKKQQKIDKKIRYMVKNAESFTKQGLTRGR